VKKTTPGAACRNTRSARGDTVLGDIERQELRAFLINAVSDLTEQEKLVIALYYYEELTLREIGEVMSISESRVSQIHTKSVDVCGTWSGSASDSE